MPERFKSFREFYPYYLSEHADPRCRALHYLGSSLVLATLGYLLISGNWGLWWMLPLIGYGFAWVGHFVFEKNRPATFRYPWYSFLGDWLMWWQFITAKRR
ncbi:DUF962 domain-containing protein [Shewanella khirikhana]|uniref:DUF962 domain-containing protein n=1 Tax=Shewanella khirikhana TaxID=1965282 RepID=A0ABN5TS01_9GAMM|nr:DUF962 domain-containing protein [Shewanella khirikhana]AZQ09821.1 hypothetical protein STH12_00682 [Shewanella khirikhana]